MNYYRRYLGDYMGKTMHLSMMQHGAYTLLLDAYYATEKPLQADYDSLYRVCRAMTKPEKDAVRSVVDAFFPAQSDGLRHNQRADEEIATAQATIEKQRESAVNTAVKRGSTTGLTARSTVRSTARSSASQTGQPSTTNLQPLTTNHQPSPNTAAEETPPGLDAQAWDVWKDYRKKINKGLKPVSILEAQRELTQHGEDQMAVVKQSIANGYQGLFPLKNKPRPTVTGHRERLLAKANGPS